MLLKNAWLKLNAKSKLVYALKKKLAVKLRKLAVSKRSGIWSKKRAIKMRWPVLRLTNKPARNSKPA
jgi:hypothetical protein